MSRRGLLYFTLSEIKPRIWFMLAGCNFRCRGCFRPARDVDGTVLTPEETLKKAEQACLNYYGELATEAIITGGEPTISKEYLLSLIKGLKKKGIEEIVLITNGYEIGREENGNYASDLKEAGLTEAYVDLKAFSDRIHRWYTGKSNKPVLNAIKKLNDAEIKLLIQTVYMPGIVDEKEIERMAEFLSSLNKELKYQINPFSITFAREKVTRLPTIEEMKCAYEIAYKYLPNAMVSRSGCAREYPVLPPQKTWITVFPDLTYERRTVKEQHEEHIKWLDPARPREEINEDRVQEVELHDKILRTRF